MTTTATAPTEATPLEAAREKLGAIDARLAEIDARLAEIPDHDAALRLALARGETSEKQVRRDLEGLAREAEALEAERGGLSRDRDATSLVVGEHEQAERERLAEEALEAGAAVQARIEDGWRKAGRLYAQLAGVWDTIAAAETELAELRGRLPDMGRRAELASPSVPLPSSFEGFVRRLYDVTVDPRHLGREAPAHGRAGGLLPDLTEHRVRTLWIADVQSYLH